MALKEIPPYRHASKRESTWVDVRNFRLPTKTPGYPDRPPPYDPDDIAGMTANRGGRPSNFWRVQIEDSFALEPWAPLKYVRWCQKDETIDAVEYELNFKKSLGTFHRRFGWYHGLANSASDKSPAFTYTPSSGTIKSADDTSEIKCDYHVDRALNQQYMSFHIGSSEFRWESDRVQSTMEGRIWDETGNKLLDQSGKTMATVNWLYPNGAYDGCMQPHSDSQDVLSEEMLILTFSVYMHHQWETMSKEVASMTYKQRLPTWQAVEARFSRGRMITYCCLDMSELERLRQKLHDQIHNSGYRAPDISSTLVSAPPSFC